MDRDILKKGLLEYGFNLSEKEENRLNKYSRLLVEWNEKINLTSIVDPEGISIKHFLDSIVPIFKIDIKKESKMIDVGTGAGFPGIPIKIIRDDLDVTYLDSLNKRINFLKIVKDELGLEKASFIHMRAEEAGKDKLLREKFDIAVSRAVAPLKILAEYSLPLVKVGGIFAAFKSFDIENELNEAKSMIGNLGGKVIKVEEVKIPCSDILRKIVVIEKIKETPKNFPRRVIKK